MNNRTKWVVVWWLFILGFLVYTLTNCVPNTQVDERSEINDDFNTIVIDSCEYIEYAAGEHTTRVYSITHKGNCKFCKERN